jgi:hypothetical protein
MRIALGFCLLGLASAARELALAQDWFQAYSDYYIQSTQEIDWKCVTVQVNQTDDPGVFTFVKHGALHGGTRPVTSLIYTAVLAGPVATISNPNAQAIYDIKELTEDLAVFTSSTDESLFVWTTNPDGIPDEQKLYLLNQLESWGFSSGYKEPMESYDFEACPDILQHTEPPRLRRATPPRY